MAHVFIFKEMQLKGLGHEGCVRDASCLLCYWPKCQSTQKTQDVYYCHCCIHQQQRTADTERTLEKCYQLKKELNLTDTAQGVPLEQHQHCDLKWTTFFLYSASFFVKVLSFSVNTWWKRVNVTFISLVLRFIYQTLSWSRGVAHIHFIIIASSYIFNYILLIIT